MPTQKESHAKRASISLTPRFSCRVVASRRLNRRGTPACPDQSPRPKMQNEPNLTPPSPRIMSKRSGDPEGSLPAEGGPMADKTNPIPRTAGVSTTQKMRNEPNSPPRPPCPTPKKRNEPNFHRSQISNLRFPPIRHGVLCETNPICPHSPLCHNQNIRNEPNPGTHSVRPPYPPPIMRNEPNLPRAQLFTFHCSLFYKTNPIPPMRKMRNEPKST